MALLIRGVAFTSALVLAIEVLIVYVAYRSIVINVLQKSSTEVVRSMIAHLREAIEGFDTIGIYETDGNGRLTRPSLIELLTLVDLCMLRPRTCPKYLAALIAQYDPDSPTTSSDGKLVELLYKRNADLADRILARDPVAPPPTKALEEDLTSLYEKCKRDADIRMGLAPASTNDQNVKKPTTDSRKAPPPLLLSAEGVLANEISSWSSGSVRALGRSELGRIDSYFLLFISLVGILFLISAVVPSGGSSLGAGLLLLNILLCFVPALWLSLLLFRKPMTRS
jgi:hypothetical protein